jgi:hypothetical protein
MTKANKQQQQQYKNSVVPMDQIEENATQLKHTHSKVTEAQAEDATQALATMRELLNAKSQFVRLEASKDLMDRAGLRAEPVRNNGTAVQINFNME